MSEKYRNQAELLAEVLLHAQSKTELIDFLMDITTANERKDLWERWKIIDMLFRKYSQREIRDELGISISKVTRGSLGIKKSFGGFQKLWARWAKSNKLA